MLNFADEARWNGLAHPGLHAWPGDDEPVRLLELATDEGDPNPETLAC